MREIRDGGKVIGVERIAILAALNIAHELLSTRAAAGLTWGSSSVECKHGGSDRRGHVRAGRSVLVLAGVLRGWLPRSQSYPLRCLSRL